LESSFLKEAVSGCIITRHVVSICTSSLRLGWSVLDEQTHLHVTGDLVGVLGAEELEGRGEEEHLGHTGQGPGAGPDGVEAGGHLVGDAVVGGHEAGQLQARREGGQSRASSEGAAIQG
jgi:hypothetical protein